MIVGTFSYRLFSDTDRSLGGFVGFIECFCDYLNLVLARYSLQSIGSNYCLPIDSLTQFDGTGGVNFYLSFLFGHWLVSIFK